MTRARRLFTAGAPVLLLIATGAQADPPLSTPPDFLAPLSGAQEVPARDTIATGNAQFRVVEDGNGVAYRLIVEDIANVVASHIHLAPFGVNGSVVVFLYPNHPAGGGPIEGIIAEGVIHQSDLIGPLAGQSLSVLIEALRTGGSYVNVHTNDGLDPSNTGPGDFPGGEIRGQIKKAVANNPHSLLFRN